MSRIGAIREGLVTALKTATLPGDPDPVPALAQVLAYPPASIAVNGTAYIGGFDTAVQDGQRTVDLHTVPLVVAVNLNHRHEGGMQATEPVIDAVRAALRANQGLGSAGTERVEVTRVAQRVFGDPVQSIGFEMTLVIKESYGVSFS